MLLPEPALKSLEELSGEEEATIVTLPNPGTAGPHLNGAAPTPDQHVMSEERATSG
jgi:hypothetical protein